ncbi:hypothetical protein RP20_CCG025119 [Aedes albopictus]|nr:hypothetical protein RP20_CCG025119 [Aedes albopictus]
MSQKDNTSQPADAANAPQQYLRDLANGSFGLIQYSYLKTSDAAKYVARGIHQSPYTAQVVDATNTVGHGTIAAGKQLYHKIRESPITEQTLQLTQSAVGNLANAGYNAAVATYDAGQQAYQVVATSPLTGPVVRFAGAAIGSTLTWSLMASSVASRAGREVARASCIRSSMWIFNSLHLPNSMRAAAVFTGVRAHDYIASGLIPGLFTAWAIYDGYRVARYCYNMYQDHNKKQFQLQQSDQFEYSVQKWRNFYEDVAAHNRRILFLGMYAPQ